MADFITRSGGQFMYKGKRFRFIGMNYYPFMVNTESVTTMQALFKPAADRGINVFRTWCFDVGNLPSNSAGNFRYLSSASVGSNILPNSSFETDTSGWSLDGNFVRSNADAHTGSWSVKQTSVGGFQNFTTLNDATGITVTPNTNYTFQFWYKLAVTGNGPIININTGSTFGANIASGFPGDTGGVWTQGSINFNPGSNNKVWIRIFNNNGTVTGYWDDLTIGTAAFNFLSWREATLVQLDTLLNTARQYGVKLILSLADNPTYLTKNTYVQWANSIYGSGLSTSFPYSGFFDSADCRTIYKQFFSGLANRVNTINGLTYKNDDTIFSWELGNELRYDQFEGATVNTISSTNIAAVTSWITDITAYMKSVDPNHLIGYGDMGHTWQYAQDNSTGNQDVVSNGSFYGVDYNLYTALTNIDYLDFHTYPTQADPNKLNLQYGIRLGYTGLPTQGDGYRAQLRDYVNAAKANNKPVVCGELGMVKEYMPDTTYFPLSPRHVGFKEIFDVFFGADGDGMILWSATSTGGGSYSCVLNGWDGSYGNANSNDIPLMNIITRRVFKGNRVPSSANT